LAWSALRGNGFGQVGDWIGAGVENSVLPAALAATLLTAVGLVLGRSVAGERPGSAWLDALAVFAFVTPAAVLGVGIIDVWNRPATHAVYRTVAILVIGFTARYAVIPARAIARRDCARFSPPGRSRGRSRRRVLPTLAADRRPPSSPRPARRLAPRVRFLPARSGDRHSLLSAGQRAAHGAHPDAGGEWCPGGCGGALPRTVRHGGCGARRGCAGARWNPAMIKLQGVSFSLHGHQILR